jgi:hypothetical protein
MAQRIDRLSKLRERLADFIASRQQSSHHAFPRMQCDDCAATRCLTISAAMFCQQCVWRSGLFGRRRAF